MKKYSLIVLLLVVQPIVSCNLFGDDDETTEEEIFGEPKISEPSLEQLDLLESSFRDGLPNFDLDQESYIELPVKIHIVTKDNGSGGISNEIVADIIERTNVYLQAPRIRLLHCEPNNIIADSDNFDFKSENDAIFTAIWNEANLINVYFFNSIDRSFLQESPGYTFLPFTPNKNHIMMAQVKKVEEGTTPIHEFGHYFSLLHTHGPFNDVLTTELVNKSNCITDGDLICDTKADPNLNGKMKYSGCSYNGSLKDANGEPFDPDVHNIMSYSWSRCRNTFTAEQINRMAFSARNHRTYLATECPPNTGCPNLGQPCNDNNPNTVNDAINLACICEGQPVSNCLETTGEFTFINNTNQAMIIRYRPINTISYNESVLPSNEEQGFFNKPEGVYDYEVRKESNYDLYKSGEIWTQKCDEDKIYINNIGTSNYANGDYNNFLSNCEQFSYGTFFFKNNRNNSIKVRLRKTETISYDEYVIPPFEIQGFYEKDDGVFDYEIRELSNYDLIKSGEIWVQPCDIDSILANQTGSSNYYEGDLSNFNNLCIDENYGSIRFNNNRNETITIRLRLLGTISYDNYNLPPFETQGFYEKGAGVFEYEARQTSDYDIIKSGEILVEQCQESITNIN